MNFKTVEIILLRTKLKFDCGRGSFDQLTFSANDLISGRLQKIAFKFRKVQRSCHKLFQRALHNEPANPTTCFIF